jgi:multidrug efflux pump subunit AcrB
VVFAMLASYLLSRTLVPTLVMYLLKNHEHEDKFRVGSGFFAPFKRLQIWFERRFEQLRDAYHRTLRSAMDHRGLFVTCFLAFCILSMGLVFFLGQDFFPSVDAGIFRMHVRGRAGLRIEETKTMSGPKSLKMSWSPFWTTSGWPTAPSTILTALRAASAPLTPRSYFLSTRKSIIQQTIT